MRSRVTLVALFATCLVVLAPGAVDSLEPPPPQPAASAVPDLPPDVTLAMLAARRRYTCDILNGKVTNEKISPTYTASIPEVMPKILELKPTSLDAAAAAPNATPYLKSLCNFLRKANCPNDVVEALIRANCREKLYKNSDIISAAAGRCSPDRVARWRQLYPDQVGEVGK